jgi:hypothetical protein
MRPNEPFQIVQAVRSKIVCPMCQKQFAANAVDLVELINNRGVFATHCSACNASAMLVLNIREFKQRIARREAQVEKVNQSRVSPNDVINIKDFLNSFSGTLDDIAIPDQKINDQNPVAITTQATKPQPETN